MSRLRTKRRAEEQGFTLIELLIVIVILGILAAIVVFSVGGITDRGSRSACEANVETINIASESFRTQNTGYAATLPALQTAGFLKTIPGTLAGNGLSFTVSNPGGTDYTVTYDPATGLATSTCPAGSTGSTGGGGGGTTTTTVAACTFVSEQTPNVDIFGDGPGNTTSGPYTFWVRTTGTCGTITMVVQHPGPDTTISGFASGAVSGQPTQTQWTATVQDSTYNTWQDSNANGSPSCQGASSTVSIQNNGTQIGTGSLEVC